MSEHLYTYIDPPNPKHLDQIAEVLRHDGVIALPTGTSWAFAADPSSKRALQRIERLKPDRPQGRPYALLCSDISMASQMAVIDGRFYRMLKRLWPGPYTVLLPASPDLPRLLKTRRSVVGVRVPADALAMAIVERYDRPLLVSTVPRTDEGQVLTLGYEVFERHGHGLELIVDLGEPVDGTETTVLDLSEGHIDIIREGAGDISAL